MTTRLSGGSNNSENGGEMVVDRQTGASMMEQLVPEITTHALSYLDYPSLCRLSMTNSLMRKAANDDNSWKALYHKVQEYSEDRCGELLVFFHMWVAYRVGKTHIAENEFRLSRLMLYGDKSTEFLSKFHYLDFTLEQDRVTPPNGWKAYYAATRAIFNFNAEFFRIVRDRSLLAMGQFWLNADYVKCFHASGESFSGYNAVMESWQLAFSWENIDVQIQDVRTRVLSDMAWVTMKAYIDIDTQTYSVSNVYEFHNGRWYMVHHHSSPLLIHGGAEALLLQ